jgi:hypothetical protein
MLEYNAFLHTTAHYCYVMFTDKINITDSIAKAFIRAVCAKENLSVELAQKAQNHQGTIKFVKNNITRVKYADTGDYQRIYNKNLDLRYPFNDKTLVFCFYQ